MARPALQPACRWRPSRERPDRTAVHRQSRDRADQRARDVRQPALLAQHGDRRPRTQSVAVARHRHARVRVGRRSRQRRPAGGVDSDVVDGGVGAGACEGLRQHVPPRHGHAPPVALPAFERRAGLRRRHGSMGLGPRHQSRRGPRLRILDAGSEHASGDGQSARRHGHSAGDDSGRADPGERQHGYNGAFLDHRLARIRGQHPGRHDRDRVGNGCRCGRRRRRRRGIGGRWNNVASSHRHVQLELRMGAGRAGKREHSVPRHRR